ncbi:Uncharacterised protein [Mycobacteroides abscessus subsp. abscessus]|nr:Uncharacterised protein [Mycobacteroides abscessus]SHZ38191.1 Uncharacterised protein [Mycobacteroides abscessus subsp. abscessus]
MPSRAPTPRPNTTKPNSVEDIPVACFMVGRCTAQVATTSPNDANTPITATRIRSGFVKK